MTRRAQVGGLLLGAVAGVLIAGGTAGVLIPRVGVGRFPEWAMWLMAVAWISVGAALGWRVAGRTGA